MRFPQSDDRLVAHVGEARHDPIAVDQLDQGRPLQHLGGMAWKIEPHDVGDGNGGVIAQVDLARGEGTERSSQHTSVGKMRGRCIELVLPWAMLMALRKTRAIEISQRAGWHWRLVRQCLRALDVD